MKKYQVVVPDLDFVVDEFNTRSEAEKAVQKYVEWDNKHPQSYVPAYVIEVR